MRLLVIGAGGVGGYLGARLLAAGLPVTFAARGAHAEALQKQGLSIHGPGGEERVAIPHVAETRALEGQFDVVLMSVKWPGLEQACDELQRLLTPDGVVLPFLNGLRSEEVVASFVGAQRTIAAVAYMSAGLLGPGAIYVHGNTRVGIAPYRDGQQAWIDRLVQLFTQAGLPVRAHADHRTMLWEKMIWNAPFNAICALTGKNAGEALARCPELVRDAMREVVTVARADGVQLPDVLVDVMLQVTRSEYPQTEPSMLQDVRAGRPTEVDILQGAVADRARELGVEAPVLRTLAALIRGIG